MDKSLIIILVIAILAVLLVISIIKKAIKLIFTIIAIIVAISLVDIFVYGVSPIDELNAYKTNVKYGRDVASLTGKVKESAQNIKKVLENKKLDEEANAVLKVENDNLHKYKEQFEGLQHTKRLESFHKSYLSYLNNILSISDSTVKLASSGSGAIEDAQGIIDKIKNYGDKITNLKISFK